MFRCVMYHPQGELRILAQNRQLFISLLHKLCYNAYNIPFFVDYSTYRNIGTTPNPDKISTPYGPSHSCKKSAHTLTTPLVAAHSKHILGRFHPFTGHEGP